MSVEKRTEGKGVLGRTTTTVSITKGSTARERKDAAAALSAMASTEQFPARAVVQNYKQAAEKLLAERGLKFGDNPAHMEPIEREAVNVIAQALAVSRYMDEGNIDAAVYCAMELSDNVWRIGIRAQAKSGGDTNADKITPGDFALAYGREFVDNNRSAGVKHVKQRLNEDNMFLAEGTIRKRISALFPEQKRRGGRPRKT